MSGTPGLYFFLARTSDFLFFCSRPFLLYWARDRGKDPWNRNSMLKVDTHVINTGHMISLNGKSEADLFPRAIIERRTIHFEGKGHHIHISSQATFSIAHTKRSSWVWPNQVVGTKFTSPDPNSASNAHRSPNISMTPRQHFRFRFLHFLPEPKPDRSHQPLLLTTTHNRVQPAHHNHKRYHNHNHTPAYSFRFL